MTPFHCAAACRCRCTASTLLGAGLSSRATSCASLRAWPRTGPQWMLAVQNSKLFDPSRESQHLPSISPPIACHPHLPRALLEPSGQSAKQRGSRSPLGEAGPTSRWSMSSRLPAALLSHTISLFLSPSLCLSHLSLCSALSPLLSSISVALPRCAVLAAGAAAAAAQRDDAVGTGTKAPWGPPPLSCSLALLVLLAETASRARLAPRERRECCIACQRRSVQCGI